MLLTLESGYCGECFRASGFGPEFSVAGLSYSKARTSLRGSFWCFVCWSLNGSVLCFDGLAGSVLFVFFDLRLYSSEEQGLSWLYLTALGNINSCSSSEMCLGDLYAMTMHAAKMLQR